MSECRQHAVNMIGKQTNNEGFFAVPAPGSVTIDGRFDDWDLSGQIQSYADSSVKDVFSVKTAAMWDKDYLYLAFDWRDPYPMESQFNPLQDPGRGWMSDSVQLRILAGNQPSWFTTWCFEGDKPAIHVAYLEAHGGELRNRENADAQFVLYAGESGVIELGQGAAMAYRMAADGKGFTQEVRLPWTLLYAAPHTASPGESIRLGMDFHYGPSGGRGRPIHSYCDNVRPGTSMRSFFWVNTDLWGDLTLLDHPVAEKRIYREEEEAPAGTIPLRCKVPLDAKTFNVTVNTAAGERIRNVLGGVEVQDYMVGEEAGQAIVEVLWDGLDERGQLVPAGEYVLQGVVSNGIDGYFESTFYNPGTPSWATPDTSGGWCADHTIPKLVAAAGEKMIIASTFAEGGHALIMLEACGAGNWQKRWGDLRGTDSLAANEKYVFIIPNDWDASGVALLRMDVQTARFVPFVQGDQELPMPCRLDMLFGLAYTPIVLAMTMHGNELLIRCDDHVIRAVDAETGALLRSYPLTLDGDARHTRLDKHAVNGSLYQDEQHCTGMTCVDDVVFYIVDNRVCRLDLCSGECSETPIAVAVVPAAITCDRAGRLYIVDSAAQQIIKCTEDGQELLRIGKPGGRALVGKYDRNALLRPNDVAVDAEGYVWITERCKSPRRVSVWNADGVLVKEYIGNSGYSSQGTLIHDDDAKKAFAEFCEMTLDTNGEWRVEQVMYQPDPLVGLAFPPASTPFDSGSMFYSEASGTRREYFAAQGWHSSPMLFVMMRKPERWVPVAGISTVAWLLSLVKGSGADRYCEAPCGEWKDCDPQDIVFWNDTNGDGYVSRDECVIVPALGKSERRHDGEYVYQPHLAAYEISSSGAVGRDDLSCYMTKRIPGGKSVVCYVRPVSFRDDGMPVYLPEGITPQTDAYKMGLEASPYPVPGQDLTLAFIEIEKECYLAGLRRSDGAILWLYRSPYQGVHGSHLAPMPQPGLLIGCLKIAGIAKDCGGSDVFMIRGNMGEDYFLTTDGMYIGRLTRDGRLPGLAIPGTVDELKKISYSQLSGIGEPFCGSFARQDDGVVRAHGCIPAKEAGNIVRIEGLEQVRRYEPVSISLTDEMLVQAEEANRKRALNQMKPVPPLQVIRNEGEIVQWDAATPYEIAKKGQSVRAQVRMLYDDGNLYLRYELKGMRWVNGGDDWHLLFKTGDCVDFQCSPTANRQGEPVLGDFRLLIAPFEGKNVAVLMRQVEEYPQPNAGFKYNSPVTSIQFATVRRVNEAKIDVGKADEAVTVTACIPWAALDLAVPVPSTEWTGDVGFIVADATGKLNAARVYRNNPSTNLVKDQPNEARIMPNGFGALHF